LHVAAGALGLVLGLAGEPVTRSVGGTDVEALDCEADDVVVQVRGKMFAALARTATAEDRPG
jgi:hypothetical protein